jgi:hypothetical protein
MSFKKVDSLERQPPSGVNLKLNNMSKKYKIELSEDQMRLIADCMDDVSRFASGQWQLRQTIEAMVEGLPFDEKIKRRNEAEELLRQAKRVLLPDFVDNQSYGYNSTEFIGNCYQISRTIMYRLAIDNDWNNVYSSPALPSGTMGTIKIEQI